MSTIKLIVFDLDGVITSEEAYWVTAGLVIHELLYSPRYWNVENTISEYIPVTSAEDSYALSQLVLPETAIVGYKSRAVNSNWDTCYCGFCLYLIHLLSLVPDKQALFPLRPADDDWIVAFRKQLSTVPDKKLYDTAVLDAANDGIFQGYNGLEYIHRFNTYASQILGLPVADVFERYSPSWRLCERLFQEWYLGDKLFEEDYGQAPVQPGKRGCIRFEQPLLPLEQLRPMFEALQKQGYTFGVATGRPELEALLPLEQYGLLQYFDRKRVVTHAQVAAAENALSAQGTKLSLVKPDPYQFLLSAHPEHEYHSYSHKLQTFLVVGDTPSDVRGAHAAGAIMVAVRTGAKTVEAMTILEQSKPDFLIENVTQLPQLVQQLDSLATIQRLQFNEREKAEHLLLRWFALYMDVQVEQVTLTPKAVSLNSFNGFYRMHGEEYFFKTHVEEQGTLEEYYHAEVLRQAGYNIVRPIRTVHEQGQQMVIYPVVRWPVMFDLMRTIETSEADNAQLNPTFSAETLVAAERRECEHLLRIYEQTFEQSTAEDHAKAPIHQLFWHRLTGGRLDNFYMNKHVQLPDQKGTLPFEMLLSLKWRLNGVEQKYTLGELIERAKVVLNPSQSMSTMSTLLTVIGHGDAHFGNVFLEDGERYLYFDPAFAGRHTPLLDCVKPLFHNVFATWMYFPNEIARTLAITVSAEGTTLVVDHNYTLTPVRQAMLRTKEEYLLNPLLAELRSRRALPDNWLEILQSALLCCPLLTMNLIDAARMPTNIGWLGFALAVFIGNNGIISWNIEGKGQGS